ncbi:MAG TPA: hypothetical protein PLH64_07675 [Anaerolineaceae bacterium]|nr:hypothetical protein [Anaerolineaceae bacterium]HQO64953.1 hypothetical protein [Syntrophorhabdus sp.]
MKIKTILLTSLLVVSLLLASCGSKKPTETTVNLPVISGQTENTTVAPATTEVSPVTSNPYPVQQATEPSVVEVALAYPVGDDSSAAYATEMRAYIEQILGGTIAIEDLFGKDDDELRVILRNAAQGRIILTETGLDRAADWLEKQ